jgi:hypothetical protein
MQNIMVVKLLSGSRVMQVSGLSISWLAGSEKELSVRQIVHIGK